MLLFVIMFVDTQANNPSMILVAVGAGVGMMVVGFIGGLIVGIVYMGRRRQPAKNGIPMCCM